MSNLDAARAASELVRQMQRGEDYERAEWALVTAQSLLVRAKGVKRARTREVRMPLELVPRVLAYWGRLGKAGESRDFGVHLVAFGTRAAPLLADARHWAQDTQVQGREASVFAATTWEDEALIAQGRTLAQHFGTGAFELLVGIEPLEPPKRGALVMLSGQVDGSDFVIDETSVGLAHVHWDVLMRTLVDPLRELHGSVFPPDELAIQATSPAELDAARRAAEHEGDLVCTVEGLAMRCRGGVGDVRAAARGLLRSARATLGADSNALWSGHE
jgi:hypothetical protein